MNVLVTTDWLRQQGVDLPEEKLETLVKIAQDELEIRIGNVLMTKLTPEQLDAFEKLYDAGKEDEALDWLHEAIPAYKETVSEESEKLHKELQSSGDKVALIESWGSK